MGSCDVFCAKYAVFTINLVSVLIGILFIVVGTVDIFVYNHHVNFTTEQLLSTPFIFIIFGVIVVLISLFGLCGAITRNSCMVLTFSNLLIILLACQLGVGIYGSIRQDQANDVWDQIFNETLNKRELHRETWDVMQPTLQCCGVYGPEDWTKINQQLPDSCCQIHRQDVSCDIGDAFKIGCKAALFDFFQSHYIILASVLLSVFVIQILLIGWSCFLYGAFSREKNYSSVSSNLDRFY